MKFYRLTLLLGAALCAQAQITATDLPTVTVYSPRVANQDPVGTFAMPVSALRFEPLVDLQARNMAEGQADVTIRGGIFENTGFNVGAVSLTDPQTGHYYAEIPVAAAMLSAPAVVTGAEHALQTSGSTVGAVVYGWRPVANTGAASISGGTDDALSAEVYEGRVRATPLFGRTTVAGDVAWAHSEGNGAVNFGDYHFDRANARVQLKSANAQTDLFAGYQAKFFGWPNLYTPFNSAESENLQTVLLAVNHRADLGAGDFIEAGAYHRRNKDDYAFNRFAAVGAVHPFQHTTWVSGAAVDGRKSLGEVVTIFRGEFSADDLKSTSLTFGPYHARTLAKLALALEKSWALSDNGAVTAQAGATYDDSNHGGGTISPVLEVARTWRGTTPLRLYASYAGSSQLPSYTALKSNPAAGLFRGNANLGREKSRNAEIGATASLGGWTGQAAGFYRQDVGLVDWTFRRGVTARAANAVDIDTTGFELVVRRSWAQLDLVLGYTALTKDANYRGAVVDASFYALNYARHRLTAAVVYRFASEWELRFDNAARVQADNLLRAVGGDETLISSAGLFYRPRAWRGATLSVRADNLWNSNYQEVPAVPAAPRQLAVGVGYVW
jgi:hypothetical protein